MSSKITQKSHRSVCRPKCEKVRLRWGRGAPREGRSSSRADVATTDVITVSRWFIHVVVAPVQLAAIIRADVWL
ncbi:hypothetical protein JOB18_029257 [Solea senegalensis]|uniref:Uncharacterized protein n=1 Tax=Solea senegalensis TaxID=28829 RepID=A0AAV6R0N9_SOLSE|nr:hypothetical protein JOB18_029257 [Solea senegalensis]